MCFEPEASSFSLSYGSQLDNSFVRSFVFFHFSFLFFIFPFLFFPFSFIFFFFLVPFFKKHELLLIKIDVFSNFGELFWIHDFFQNLGLFIKSMNLLSELMNFFLISLICFYQNRWTYFKYVNRFIKINDFLSNLRSFLKIRCASFQIRELFFQNWWKFFQFCEHF